MRTWAEAGTRRSREGRIQVGRSGGLTRCGLGPEPDPRLSYQAGTWLIWSRTGRVRVGRSGSQHAPHAADLPENEPGRPSPSWTKQELTSTTAGLGRSRTHD